MGDEGFEELGDAKVDNSTLEESAALALQNDREWAGINAVWRELPEDKKRSMLVVLHEFLMLNGLELYKVAE